MHCSPPIIAAPPATRSAFPSARRLAEPRGSLPGGRKPAAQANTAAAAATPGGQAVALFTAEEGWQLAAPPREGTVFYTHCLCPYAERVWIALLEKGLPHRLVHIDLSRKPAWYRSVNPRGLVPALQLDGSVVVESADICRHVDAQAAGPSLTPQDPPLQRQMEALLRGPCSGAVSVGLDLMAGATARHWGIGSGQTAAQRAAFEVQLAGLDAALRQHGGPFLLGPQPSLADIMVYPFLKRYAVAQPLTGYDVGAALGGSVGRWLAAMGARPSCRTTSADDALLLQAYQQHRSLDFFDLETYSCCQLHPHNATHLLHH